MRLEFSIRVIHPVLLHLLFPLPRFPFPPLRDSGCFRRMMIPDLISAGGWVLTK
jgi:hypothetical protein